MSNHFLYICEASDGCPVVIFYSSKYHARYMQTYRWPYQSKVDGASPDLVGNGNNKSPVSISVPVSNSDPHSRVIEKIEIWGLY